MIPMPLLHSLRIEEGLHFRQPPRSLGLYGVSFPKAKERSSLGNLLVD